MPLKYKTLPDVSALRQMLRYDADTGYLYWLSRPIELFIGQTLQGSSSWNGRLAGKQALCTINRSGYYCGTLFNSKVLAHRVIWKLVTGEEPRELDHIDGDTLNNRMRNLRSVSHSENQRNLKLAKNNKSGTVGVFLSAGGDRWIAKICINRKGRHLGTFDTFDEAKSARRQAEREHGFALEHGQKR